MNIEYVALDTLQINGVEVREWKTTFENAFLHGVFDKEAYPGDWTGRAVKRPFDWVYVYFFRNIGDKRTPQLLGYVDGEGASFRSLYDWLAGIK